MNLFEQFVVRRLTQQIAISPEMESVLLDLLRSAKEGHLCSIFEGELPGALCADGMKEPYSHKPLVRYGNRLYFQKNWMLETHILNKILEIGARPIPPCDTARFHQALENERHRLNPAQFEAVSNGFTKNLTIFYGGPGTGKTYTAATFIRLLASSHERYKVIISAPTGKAAAHLESVFQSAPVPHMQWESMTLHRMLRLRPRTQQFTSSFMIDADLVVVDEASMMDGHLLLHLLNAVGPQTRLLLLGDADQLPPVEGVSFFPEIAQKLGHKLTQSVRMAEGTVGKIAQAILEERAADIPRLPWEPKEEVLVERLCKILPSPHHAQSPDPIMLFEELSRFRILCALRQGPFGVDSLNRQILAKFQAKNGSDYLTIPILISQNSPKQQLYNGTTGILIRKNGIGTAYFCTEGGIRSIAEKALPLFEVAFCLSIHKSQGSEFDQVLILLGPGSERFGKAALYTGVTRARKKVEIWAEESTFQAAIAKKTTFNSGFLDRFHAQTN